MLKSLNDLRYNSVVPGAKNFIPIIEGRQVDLQFQVTD